MMKSFFKKLAFVMALAMVVSMVAPAGSAFAATTGVAYQTSKEVVTAYEFAKAGDTVDFCFLGAPSDWKSTFKWESSNPAVATVDKAGIVTAVAAGTATITITAGADASYKETVTVTVPAAIDFEIAQVDTVTATLTFNAGADLTGVAVDDFAVTAIDDMFEYTLFANTVAVKDNVVTLTFVEGVLTDGAVIKIGYKDVEKTLVASNGEVAKVTVSYGMNKNYAGDAYVYTELDPDYVLLSYKLYDANGIDVTANFDENEDYTVEWTLTNGGDYASEPEEDADNGWQMSFDAKGAATVQATVTFTDEDGEEKDIPSAPATIVAKDRPSVAFDYSKAGVAVFGGWYANTYAMVTSFNNPNGSVWEGDMSWAMANSSIEKGQSGWFSAKLTDNRGKELTTTQLTYEGTSGWDLLSAEGDTNYKDYGYFVYESSNEDVLAIDDEGRVTGIEVGNATVLVSFVKYNEDGEEMDPVKVCSKRISVTTDHPEPYAKTFTFTNDALTVTSTGASVAKTTYLKFYDQYGRIYTFGYDMSKAAEKEAAGDLVDFASIVTVPSTYEDAADLFEVGTPVKNSNTGDEWAFPVSFSGDEFMDLEDTDIKDNGYSTFKFTVEFEKDIEEFSKIVTKNDKVGVKVYNVDEYFADLKDFYSTTTPAIYMDGDDEVDTDFVKWNWSSYCNYGNSVNTYVDNRSEFGHTDPSWQEGCTFGKTIGINLLTPAGLKLMSLPATHFIELTEKVDKINKRDEVERNLIEGAIYYQISVPSKAENFEVATGSAVNFTFNKVDGLEVKAATEGTYSVALYYVNSQNKLVKLGGGAQNVTVTNSTPAVKAEGFKESNVYEGTLRTYADVKKALEEMYNFSWNGELLYEEDRVIWNEAEKEWEDYDYSENFYIYDIEYEPETIGSDDTKVVITKIIFAIDYFNDCRAEGGSVTNNKDDNYQLFELKKRITIKMD